MPCSLTVLTIHYQLIPFNCNFTFEATMGGIILEHIDHVVQSNEWIIDGHNLKKADCIYNTLKSTCEFILTRNYRDLLTSAPFSSAALSTRRPIRPNPLIPILAMMC